MVRRPRGSACHPGADRNKRAAETGPAYAGDSLKYGANRVAAGPGPVGTSVRPERLRHIGALHARSLRRPGDVMTRVLAFTAICALAGAIAPHAQQPNVVTRESVVTATIDRIEKSTRLVTVRGDQNQFLTVYVDPSISAFDELHT